MKLTPEPVDISGEHFEKRDFAPSPLPKGRYEACAFATCSFSGADISKVQFLDCEFAGCNLSLVKLTNAVFSRVRFVDCKLTGLQFEQLVAGSLSVSFERCVLQLASFVGLKLKQQKFAHCDLREVDFTEADLTGANFEGCDLAGAIFSGTVIERADFRRADHYSIDPTRNQIKQAKFSAPAVLGLLDGLDIVIE